MQWIKEWLSIANLVLVVGGVLLGWGARTWKKARRPYLDDAAFKQKTTADLEELKAELRSWRDPNNSASLAYQFNVLRTHVEVLHSVSHRAHEMAHRALSTSLYAVFDENKACIETSATFRDWILCEDKHELLADGLWSRLDDDTSEKLRMAMSNGRPMTHRGTLQRGDGSPLAVLMSLQPMRDASNKLTGYLLNFSDCRSIEGKK